MSETETPRMTPLSAADYSAEQAEAAVQFEATRGVKVAGPFALLIRSPEVLKHAQALGAFLRYRCSISGPLSEFAIMVIAREWTQNYEWHIHSAIGLKAGIDAGVIEDLRVGRRPSNMSAEQTAIYDLSTELMRDRKVSDDTYARALSLFGEKGIIDLVAINGYYGLLAMAMNTARMALPEGATPLPPLPATRA
ncbi:MAG: carboxymuconolactone decarboxylase family protein [Beijerinckiaceae bacterium]|nr:carboxymuconolactone decarboxylase family protein [Beijerinckiaceae bacterium]